DLEREATVEGLRVPDHEADPGRATRPGPEPGVPLLDREVVLAGCSDPRCGDPPCARRADRLVTAQGVASDRARFPVEAGRAAEGSGTTVRREARDGGDEIESRCGPVVGQPGDEHGGVDPAATMGRGGNTRKR